jgi:hypothetical protein
MEVTCPHCKTVIANYTSMKDPGDIPSPGNLMLCANCLSLCKYDDNLKLAQLTNEEKAGLTPELLFEIEGMINAVRKKKEL